MQPVRLKLSENFRSTSLRIDYLVEAFTSKGLNHFNNVYFVTILEWSPLKASWIWFARDLVRFLFQTLLSAHVDKTDNKKKILYVVAFQKLFAGIIMVSTTNFALRTTSKTSTALAAARSEICMQMQAFPALPGRHYARGRTHSAQTMAGVIQSSGSSSSVARASCAQTRRCPVTAAPTSPPVLMPPPAVQVLCVSKSISCRLEPVV